LPGIVALAPGALLVAMPDPADQLAHRFFEGSGEGVIHRVGENIRTRRDEMRGHAEWGASFRLAIDHDPCLIDLKHSVQFLHSLRDFGRESRRGFLVLASQDQFHVRPIILRDIVFEYYEIFL
jgi:hypothetical protein